MALTIPISGITFGSCSTTSGRVSKNTMETLLILTVCILVVPMTLVLAPACTIRLGADVVSYEAAHVTLCFRQSLR